MGSKRLRSKTSLVVVCVALLLLLAVVFAKIHETGRFEAQPSIADERPGHSVEPPDEYSGESKVVTDFHPMREVEKEEQEDVTAKEETSEPEGR